ncbi:hypothetical protein CRE_20921 [Caenorhabditis remanei]|uniref:Uncharacterized protein n=1 Tax=Caenorhabditis remanei TaxID=31234 RepID=E3N916_CAERE|nr:hypothetical protein CRE_20921 [Caenorhabditis remanei]
MSPFVDTCPSRKSIRGDLQFRRNQRYLHQIDFVSLIINPGAAIKTSQRSASWFTLVTKTRCTDTWIPRLDKLLELFLELEKSQTGDSIHGHSSSQRPTIPIDSFGGKVAGNGQTTERFRVFPSPSNSKNILEDFSMRSKTLANPGWK